MIPMIPMTSRMNPGIDDYRKLEPLRSPKRVDNFQHRESMEGGITGDDASDAVFQHRGDDLGLVHLVAAEVGEIDEQSIEDLLMTFTRGDHGE